MTFGTCRYCGQVVNLDYEEETQAEADIAASEKCECYDARHERNLRKQITSATINVRGLCKAKITMTTKEKIKVERSETKTYQLEE